MECGVFFLLRALAALLGFDQVFVQVFGYSLTHKVSYIITCLECDQRVYFTMPLVLRHEQSGQQWRLRNLILDVVQCLPCAPYYS